MLACKLLWNKELTRFEYVAKPEIYRIPVHVAHRKLTRKTKP